MSSFRPYAPTHAKLPHEVAICDGVLAELRGRHAREAQEALDLGEKLFVHVGQHTVCCTTPSSESVLKHHLSVALGWCDEPHMPDDEFETVLTAIRQNVAGALRKAGKGAKPFAKQNGMGETVVRDLVKAHNKDVQIGTLAKIARGADVPLVELLRMPGSALTDASRRALEQALADALPGLPKAEGKRAQYLAAAVERVLALPSGLRGEPGNDSTHELDEIEEAAPLPHPTK